MGECLSRNSVAPINNVATIELTSTQRTARENPFVTRGELCQEEITVVNAALEVRPRRSVRPCESITDSSPKISPTGSDRFVHNEGPKLSNRSLLSSRARSELGSQSDLSDPICLIEQKCRALVKNLLPADMHNFESKSLLGELDDEVVSEINMFIFTVPPSNLKDLAQNLTNDATRYLHLIGDNSYKKSIAKTYAIYSWISSHISVNISMWKSEAKSNSDCSVESILDNGSSTPYGFALLFQAISEEIGLSVEIVKGNIRHWQGIIGEKFRPTTSNVHFWNMVKFENQPFIFDTMMGSGYTSFSLQFIKEFNAHYFGVPTNYSIFSHWPEKLSEQYLENPISYNDLTFLVAIDVATLNQGLVPINWCETINVSGADPHAAVVVKLQQEKPIIRAILQPIAQEYDESKFQDLVFIEELEDKFWKIHAVIPSSGRFILNIFLQKFPFKQKTYLSYVINCDGDPYNKCMGYPLIFPMPALSFNFKILNWNKSQKAYICKHSDKNTYTMTFKSDTDLSFHHCIVKGRHVYLEDLEHNKLLMYNTKLTSNLEHQHELSVIFPTCGWWTVHLSAGQICCDNTVSGYTKILSYCIYAEEGNEEQCYPHIFNPDLVLFKSDPITSPRGIPLQVSFESSLSKWICSVSHTSSDSSGYAVVNPVDKNLNLYQLIAIFPIPGTWCVLVHGQYKDSYAAIFKIQLSVTEGLENTYIVNSLEEANNYELKFSDSNLVSFEDNGKPFSCSFEASSELELLSVLKEETSELTDFTTFLSRSRATELSDYKLFSVFPKSGNWTIKIYARLKATCSSNYDLVATINLCVSNPSPNYCYPKIQPFFYEAGLSLKEEDALLLRQSVMGKFKLPFRAPLGTSFLCKTIHDKHPEDSQLALVQKTSDTGDSCLYAVFPELGDWMISLFAKTPDNKDATNFTEVFQILITNSVLKSQYSFPQIFEGFYKFKINFADEDIPLPSIVDLTSNLERFLIKFHCPRRASFLHYSSYISLDSNNVSSETRRMTTMVSNPDTKTFTIQVDVDTVGEWIVYLFAESKKSVNPVWVPVFKYRFLATTSTQH